jgi:23S rRNA pseudouridine2605 synthase
MERSRVQKILAQAGLASRRTAEAWLAAGRVQVNGRVAQVGESADPAVDEIRVDGRPLPSAPAPVVLALHKPAGYVTTLRDPQGRPTLRDLLPESPRLVPVGRLDMDSEGLLLCTNDGAIVQAVAHPSGGVPKRYRAWVVGRPGHESMAALTAGLVLEDGPARAIEARAMTRWEAERGLELAPRVLPAGVDAVIELVMAEGRKREVRRLLAAAGLPVARLVRIAVGPFTLTGLGPGRYRYLLEPDVRALLRAATRTASPQRL